MGNEDAGREPGADFTEDTAESTCKQIATTQSKNTMVTVGAVKRAHLLSEFHTSDHKPGVISYHRLMDESLTSLSPPGP